MESGVAPLRLVGASSAIPRSVSDTLVVRAIGAAFARTPLVAEDLRAAKLVAFVLDRLCRPQITELEADAIPLNVLRVAQLTGISKLRIEQAIAVLRQSGVLLEASTHAGCVMFSDSVRAADPPGYEIDWSEILPPITGQAAALLTLRACVDLISVPWEWTSLTYQALMLHTCYSLGMIQQGLAVLVDAGVIERSLRTGRGHEYRFSAWSLGRGAAPPRRRSEPVVAPAIPSGAPATAQAPVVGSASTPSTASGTSPMTVEIGGLVVRVPVGTEIQMTVSADGVPSYAIGPDLKIRRQS